ISNLMRQGSMIAILAVGQTFVIITSGIDLSVGAIVGFSTVVIALLLQAGIPVWAAILITLLVGLAIGIFHGFGITRMGLPQFIVYVAFSLSALFAAFVGVLLATRIGIGNATQADGWELQAIASTVIGGTSLFGAVGSVHGPLIGAFILATINNGANLLNVNS